MSAFSTRSLAERRIAAARGESAVSKFACPALFGCVALPLLLLYTQQPPASPQRPVAIIESIKVLQPIAAEPLPAVRTAANNIEPTGVATPSAAAAAPVASAQQAEHESQAAMAVLNRERAKAGGAEFASAFRVYRPADGPPRPGGDLDEPGTLARAVLGAAAASEIMLLCIGGSGSMRTGMMNRAHTHCPAAAHGIQCPVPTDLCVASCAP